MNDGVDDVKLVMLTSMGFDSDLATAALRACNGDVERAVEHILGGGGGGASSSSGVAAASSSGASGSAGKRMVRTGSISQYTVGPDGRSACTCIALCYANRFLQSIGSNAGGGVGGIVDTAISETFLSDGIMNGVEVYNKIKACGSGGVEHISAEEVLSSTAGKEAFARLALRGGVRQGVLSSDPSGPLGLRSVLNGCQSDNEIDANKWTAVVITKSPETVVIVLPASSTPGDGGYLLIDSHPRPQLSVEGSYALAHNSLNSLAQSLEIIFPATDVGSDVGDMMQMMYNSFDAYIFQA